MLVNVLAIGDVTSEDGITHLRKSLRKIKSEKKIDFTIVNGENASGVGLTGDQADRMFDAGADVVTLGNHTWGKMQIQNYLDENAYILRPANFASRVPGRGYGVFECGRFTIGLLVLIGRCDLDWKASDPFAAAEKYLKEKERTTFTLVEFHAEATSEKLAMGYYLDGKVSAVWGTHTHVPTADECVMEKGTGYITDIGMTGAVNSILGIEPEQSLEMFLGGLPGRFRAAKGPQKAQGCIFTLDSDTGKCVAVERIDIR